MNPAPARSGLEQRESSRDTAAPSFPAGIAQPSRHDRVSSLGPAVAGRAMQGAAAAPVGVERVSIFEAARDLTHRGHSLRAALEALLERGYADTPEARLLLACYRRPPK